MKLYASIQSERAKKSQGGNKFLEITILGGSRDEPEKLGTIKVFPSDKNNKYGLIVHNFLVGTSEGWQIRGDGILEAKDTEEKDTRGKK